MKDKELPFGIIREPYVARTVSVDASIEDHLGRSSVLVQTWGNGEGFTVHVIEGNNERRLDLTDTQWTALKMCVKKAMQKAGT